MNTSILHSIIPTPKTSNIKMLITSNNWLTLPSYSTKRPIRYTHLKAKHTIRYLLYSIANPTNRLIYSPAFTTKSAHLQPNHPSSKHKRSWLSYFKKLRRSCIRYKIVRFWEEHDQVRVILWASSIIMSFSFYLFLDPFTAMGR